MRLPLLVFLLLLAPTGAAQVRGAEVQAVYSEVVGVPAHNGATAPDSRPPIALVFLASATGYGLGALGGYYVGLATDRSFVAEDLISDNGVLGAWAGGTTGAALGAHLANGRRGSLWGSLVASAAVQGLYTYIVTRDDGINGSRFAWVVIGVPLVGTATSVAVERFTSR